MKPTILLVNKDGINLASILKRKLSCEMYFRKDTRGILEDDILKYDISIIDASDDVPVGRYDTLSEFLKSKNPNMIIIGTSIMGEYFQKDPLSKQLYDERMSAIFLHLPEHIQELKTKISKYGFEFPKEEK